MLPFCIFIDRMFVFTFISAVIYSLVFIFVLPCMYVCNRVLGVFTACVGWGFHLMFIPVEVNYSYNCEQQDIVLLPIHSGMQTMQLVSSSL